MFDFTGKVAVITGGGGVLCGAFARALASYGAKVAVLDLNFEAAQKVVEDIVAQGGVAQAVQCDVLDYESVLKAAESVEKTFRGWDILINGAGGNHPRGTLSKEFFEPRDLDEKESFFDLALDGFRFVFDLNLFGTIIPTQVFGRAMARRGKGVIINIASMASFRAITRVPAYAAAKAAVVSFTQWLAVYLGKSGVRVNAIAPGFFLTQQNYRLLVAEDGTLTPRAQKILAHTPMGRLGEPKELIGTLLWLCDDEASGFVTGVVVPVDGGFLAYAGV
ncbi:MAG: SDR family oxidoreductase [Candidatus Caldatribacterium sp.]|uniref:SDR family oxidoreductase n=1 Tax=Candidatus Caldatribacterium sp. TaxID=2282143 RepID=UPI002990C371|nr:SDR family oxidoreductase [Candidatus Caldatribacterium sp.]MCX7730200.1 SDR family oxidoreductase [Candidatus Caldatribacterium sp.]MDW8081584.1 SDR family oxidoreductase [Candidatus Calescibacterium sp.]